MKALDWLLTNYWEKQQTHTKKGHEDLRKRLIEYQDFQKSLSARDCISFSSHLILTNAAQMKKSEKANYTKLKAMLDGIIRLVSASSIESVLIPMLIYDGFLVPRKTCFFFFLRIKLTDSSRLKTFRTLPDRLSKMWTYALKRFSHEWPQFLSLLTIAIAKRVVELAGSYVDTREVVVCCPCIFPYLSDEALLFVITCQLVFFYLGKILLGKSPICWQDGLCFNRACVRGDPLNFQPKIQQMVIEFRHPCCSFPGL